MLTRLHRKIGSWLGLLAILMTTLAPTISHTLAARDAAAALSGAHCRASMDGMEADAIGARASMPAMRMSMPMHDGAPGDAPGKHAWMSDGDACGYCSLLAHLPVMPGIETLFAVAIPTHRQQVAVRFDSVRRAEPLAFAQPRAPPFAS
ncbi:DUF2946 domain-containing protein [Burkholderia sp. Ax-1724]|uniref:DUF2946 domain-containing protein n=1 Tax=Burkholderia sp. Ax-1724 TaxID=2608336 RepID=UPI0014204A91|nr:DUF2946 domain-containing protein [Burkholderia sp. Ax-1724]NIF51298.1 DUF2946 domain-containing protein [Burkholderia sp. Ax-1724]